TGGAWTAAPEPRGWVAYPLDLDIGEVADGYHLIARGISLSAKDLLFEFAFAPEPAQGGGGLAEHVLHRRHPGQPGLHRSGERRAVRAALAEGPVRMVRLLPARLRVARATGPQRAARQRLPAEPDSQAHFRPEDRRGADREVSGGKII